MILAYRKVKAEIWWMKTVPSLRALADYESNLLDNLTALRRAICSANFSPDEAFLGQVYKVPKKLIPKDNKQEDPIHFCKVSDTACTPEEKASQWENIEYRIMAVPSIDFQILGVLWTMAEGGGIDAQRSPACRANLMRRDYLPQDSEVSSGEFVARGPINKRYPGVFKPYFQAYKKWRDDGLRKAKAAVENGERVFALTLDLRRYFHQIDARCLRTLHPSKSRITLSFYKSLEAWQDMYGENLAESGFKSVKLGIPVGLIASGLVANLILQPLDEAIEKRISPIYYGRYVDDFFLVFSLNGQFPTGESVLEELVRIMQTKDDSQPSLRWHKRNTPKGGDDGLLEFRLRKWRHSRFVCKSKKQRLFLLEGQPGRDLLTVIDHELRQHSSEWRMVPDLCENDDQWLKEMLAANHDPVEGATSLRRADDLAIRRLGVTVAMRRLEITEKFCLNRSEWKRFRASFYKIATTHICTPEGLCEFWPNLPRLFGLVFANKDWGAANRILSRIAEAHECFRVILSEMDVLGPWLCEVIDDEVLRSCPEPPASSQAQRFFIHLKNAFGFDLHDLPSIKSGIKDFKDKDLDRKGFRVRMRINTSKEERNAFRRDIQSLTQFLDEAQRVIPRIHNSLIFPTRPLTELELCLIRPSTAKKTRFMRQSLYALRGQAKRSSRQTNDDAKAPAGPHHIKLQPEFPGNQIRVAITNYKTKEDSWIARVRGKPDLSLERLRRLFSLVDDFLRRLNTYPWREKPLYFCLPELSVPQEWIHLVSYFFSQAGVSLIAGVEYEKTGKNQFSNSAYLFLRNKDLGYPTTYVIKQSKTNPAPNEARELWQEGNYELVGPTPSELPVYVHGDFRFGVLICSELTDAEIHKHFRGHVDALFCLEWNKDTETFSALVEGTAQTVHAFIVQVNNRLFGDSRIRAPAKERYKRDIVRINGGDHDYWVVGTLPIKELRDFQCSAHSELHSEALYKPLPSGYDPIKFDRLRPE